MRTLSSNRVKHENRMGGQTKDGLPKEGGAARKLYDLFTSKKGIPISNIEIANTLSRQKYQASGASAFVIQLTDYWGLDIRSIPDRHHKCLVGEWFGDEYKDYVAEKL